ncbi:S24 family peptidase [Cupriavidus sp. WS]|uniref:S24 family peptidase n=1 Tax=Cupriavidus sp. WS TaxID=1312922 RepID=UPI0012DD7DBC|nr:S24 family peptidase [Cupriavidus sp. WS]
MDIIETRRTRLRMWLDGRAAPKKEKSYFSQLINGTSAFGEKAARRLERDYGMGDGYLDTPVTDGAPNLSPAESTGALDKQGPASDADNQGQAEGTTMHGVYVRPIVTYESLEELPKESTVLITRVDVKLSAGNGREVWHIEEREPLPFQADYIRRLDAKPKDLVAVKVKGDSMETRLFDEDTVAVDTADTRVPANGGVFALVYAGELLVKRLFRLPDNGIKIYSDNHERYEPIIVAPDHVDNITIIGRVKYRSGMGDF